MSPEVALLGRREMSDLSPHRGVKAELIKAVTKSRFYESNPRRPANMAVAQR